MWSAAKINENSSALECPTMTLFPPPPHRLAEQRLKIVFPSKPDAEASPRAPFSAALRRDKKSRARRDLIFAR